MFEFFQPLDIRRLQAAVLGLPRVVGGGADTLAPPDLVARAARIGLLEKADDLRLGELRLAHGNLLARMAIVPESSPYGPSQIRGSLRIEWNVPYRMERHFDLHRFVLCQRFAALNMGRVLQPTSRIDHQIGIATPARRG